MVTNLWTNMLAKIRIFGFCRFESVFKWNSYMDASSNALVVFFFIIFHNFSFHFSHICNRNMHEEIILLSVWNMIWKSIIYFCHFFRNIRCKLQFNYILIKGFCSNSSSKSIQKLYGLKEKKNVLFQEISKWIRLQMEIGIFVGHFKCGYSNK